MGSSGGEASSGDAKRGRAELVRAMTEGGRALRGLAWVGLVRPGLERAAALVGRALAAGEVAPAVSPREEVPPPPVTTDVAPAPGAGEATGVPEAPVDLGAPSADEAVPGPGRATPVTAWSPDHDLGARPILVQVRRGVLARIEADYARHRLGARREDETGWVLLGRRAGEGVEVTGRLRAGPGSHASPVEFEIDHGYVYAALLLCRSRGPAEVVGLAHSHPGTLDVNSGTDLATDREHVRTLPGGVGVYPILVREEAADGPMLSAGVRLAWWGMRAERAGTYVPCAPRVVPGEDDARWLGRHEAALEAVGGLALALRERGLEVRLEPAPAEPDGPDGPDGPDARGALDLIARRPPRDPDAGERTHVAMRRFAPAPGPVLLAGPTGRHRLEVEPSGAGGERDEAVAEQVLAALEALDDQAELLAGGLDGGPLADEPALAGQHAAPTGAVPVAGALPRAAGRGRPRSTGRQAAKRGAAPPRDDRGRFVARERNRARGAGRPTRGA